MTKLAPVSFKKGRASKPRLSAPRVPGKQHRRFWTDAERTIVAKYYPEGGLQACQAHLSGRSSSSIYQLVRKLGLARAGLPLFRKKHVFTAELDQRIREEWVLLNGRKKGEVGELADRLGIDRWVLTKRATMLGLTMPHKKEPPWTAAEDALMKKVPLHSPDKCADIFREHGFSRSPTAIVVRAKRIDLSRRTHDTLSARAAALILGIDSKGVTALCISGDIKAGRRASKRLPQQGGEAWAIAPAELRRYIIDHVERIDLRKVEKFAFVELLAGQMDPVERNRAQAARKAK